LKIGRQQKSCHAATIIYQRLFTNDYLPTIIYQRSTRGLKWLDGRYDISKKIFPAHPSTCVWISVDELA